MTEKSSTLVTSLSWRLLWTHFVHFCRTCHIFFLVSKEWKKMLSITIILIKTNALSCETQWPWPPLLKPSWLIQWSMGEGVLYNHVFTEWCHFVSRNEVWERGCYVTLFSSGDVTVFHRIVGFTLTVVNNFRWFLNNFLTNLSCNFTSTILEWCCNHPESII